MPYPIYVPAGKKELNDYLWKVVAPKSLQVCSFLGCKYIVIHGFKLAKYLGSEEKEWEQTESFIHSIAPLAKELDITICMENFLTTLGYRLKVLHIHDNDGVGDLHQIPSTFTRSRENLPSTDWEGFVKGLQKIRYDGVLSFETAPVLTAFPESMKQDALGFIVKIGEFFAREISVGI